jgi:GntR family transcriptional regulator/MocR family aminotransferase
LRLGFLIAPESLFSALRAAKQLADWHGELPTQAALARFIDDGLLARHIRKTTREYRARRDQLVLSVERHLAEWLQLLPAAAGLHVTVLLKNKRVLDVERVVRTARAGGVVLQTLDYFCADPPVRSGLVLGFGAISVSQIDEGIARLAECFPRARRRSSAE